MTWTGWIVESYKLKLQPSVDPTCDLTKRWLGRTYPCIVQFRQYLGNTSLLLFQSFFYIQRTGNRGEGYPPMEWQHHRPILIHKWVWQTRPLPPALSREPESVTWNGVSRLLSMVIIYLPWIWLLVIPWCNALSLPVFPSCLEKASLSWILEDSILVVTLSLWFFVKMLFLWC